MRREDPSEKWAGIGGLILIGGGILCTLVLIYFFYLYTLAGHREFSSSVAAIPYYYLPAALATLLFAALQLKRAQRINLAILFVSLGISLYAAELFFTFTDAPGVANRPLWGDDVPRHKREVKRLAKEFGVVDFDTRSMLEVIGDLRRQGTDAVPSVVPRALLSEREDGTMRSSLKFHGNEVLPLGGVSRRVTVLCNETGEYAIYNSDEHGFHNPSGLWHSNGIAILALGDSFAVGGCVPSGKGFVSLIRKSYPATLNLGMPGDGPLTMLAALKEYAPAVKPKTVLWFYYEDNDFKDLVEEKKTPLLMRYLGNDGRQNLLSRQPEIDKALLAHIEKERAEKERETAGGAAWMSHLMATAKLSELRQKVALALGASASDPTGDELELFQTILSEAKATAAGWGGKLYFVYLPAWQRYGNPQNADDRPIGYEDQVLSVVKKLGIPIVDIRPAFRAGKDPLSLFSFRRFGHYNERGHRLVAEEVLRAVSVRNRASVNPSDRISLP